MRDIIRHIHRILRGRIGHGAHHAEPFFHLTYLGAAFMEGHGVYAVAVVALAVVIVVNLIGGGEA
jgi:hypothetical protein